MYGTAAGLMVVLAGALAVYLPRGEPPTARMPYTALLGSLGPLLLHQPVLRESCWFGATAFGAFSAFWTTLAFLLAGTPYQLRERGGRTVRPARHRGCPGRPARWTAGGPFRPAWGERVGPGGRAAGIPLPVVVGHPPGRPGRGRPPHGPRRTGQPHRQPVADLPPALGGARPSQYPVHGGLLPRRHRGFLARVPGLGALGVARGLRRGCGESCSRASWSIPPRC